eukprot:3238930-Amphidinium_carterae.1
MVVSYQSFPGQHSRKDLHARLHSICLTKVDPARLLTLPSDVRSMHETLDGTDELAPLQDNRVQAFTTQTFLTPEIATGAKSFALSSLPCKQKHCRGT